MSCLFSFACLSQDHRFAFSCLFFPFSQRKDESSSDTRTESEVQSLTAKEWTMEGTGRELAVAEGGTVLLLCSSLCFALLRFSFTCWVFGFSFSFSVSLETLDSLYVHPLTHPSGASSSSDPIVFGQPASKYTEVFASFASILQLNRRSVHRAEGGFRRSRNKQSEKDGRTTEKVKSTHSSLPLNIAVLLCLSICSSGF